MYATIRVYPDSPELADALAANQGAIRQILDGIDGFESYYLVKTPGGAVSVSVFATQAGADASTSAAAAWIGENLPELKVAPPQVHAGDVVIGR